MIYRREDFVKELSYNFGSLKSDQYLTSDIDQYERIGQEPTINNAIYEQLLSINDYLRVEKDTHFKSHKGYPSPRSIYPIKMFISDGTFFYSKNIFNDCYEIYKNAHLQVMNGDIVLEYGAEYPDFYISIKKTLYLLEMGHLLYNLLAMSEMLGIQYRVQLVENKMILKQIQNSNTVDGKNISELLEKCTLRTSGPYLHPITSFQFYCAGHNEDDRMALEKLRDALCMNFDIDVITVNKYQNDGTGSFIKRKCREQESISYTEMNMLYPFINFKNLSFFVTFQLANRIFDQAGNSAIYLIALGYLAQLYCLENARQDVFCRPIKSFNIKDLERLTQLESNDSTIMYTLLCGSIY